MIDVVVNNKDIRNADVKTEVSINVSSNSLIRFVDLPSLDTVVYGREFEAKILADFFARHNKRHCAIVAPSCFGKTFLLRKFLQYVNANDTDYAFIEIELK